MDRLDEATVTILAEDTAGYDTSLTARFGLSMLLEARQGVHQTQILYDTNQAASPILDNLKTLRLSIDQLNSIFLSHCHFDHTGGLLGILQALGRSMPVIGHPSLFRPCFEMQPGGLSPIGVSGYTIHDLECAGASLILTRDPIKLMAGVMTTGEIPRTHDFELPGEMYTVQHGSLVRDPLEDDAAAVLNFPEGLVILAGCCHAGIANTIARAKALTGLSKVHAVIGGLHLWDATEDRLNKTVQALQEVDYVFAGHCTGLPAMAKLLLTRGCRFLQIYTGKVIHLPITAT